MGHLSLLVVNEGFYFGQSADTPEPVEFVFKYYLDHRARIETEVSSESNDVRQVLVTANIHHYNYTYPSWPAYHIPNDQNEVEHLNAQYEVTKIFLDHRLYLSPLSQQPPRFGLRAAPTQATSSGQVRVLEICLEYEELYEDRYKHLTSGLKSKGANVDWAATAEAALMKLNQEPAPSVILV
ncbi:hypothetical protein B0T18DRAFT_444013 [Schizothecium vesticola]|uniref:Uncharacterized protein n=1 Tax=Schizothecium vesticola TaxID=314040 RepID=A0AA40F5B7_9PEZI|nr:hypothetical protein B0T18DRAFT_444013 [Schizothecium vesticola]